MGTEEQLLENWAGEHRPRSWGELFEGVRPELVEVVGFRVGD